ncbi:pilus assembly protein FimV [Plasticicumulans lactativorans]|uniref:Pilus assembly protein FimV n=1 Tax=Plasticicumulans lactativorans TaxID=1133106 RepID=A0A4R2L1C5_9GAMM|nr:FimV/HubP family polar landmark protein [Plasticicumulans lactativorans]TCO80821.1 pilus assembly protein FimV [Plasticicumulans lactativorans]
MAKGKHSRFLVACLLLAPGVAGALGVGPLQVRSALNQRLLASVELLSVGPDDLQNLTVRLASPQEFSQAGIDRLPLFSDISFTLEARPDGRTFVRLTSQRPIREPALNFLVEISTGRGRVVREFAVLLDPVRPGQRRFAEATPGEAPLPASASSRARPQASGSAGSYGPVASGETLWSIAERLRPPTMSTRQAINRLYEANPQAFSARGPDGLRAGAMLRLPGDGDWGGAAVAATPPAAPPSASAPAAVAPPPVAPSPAAPSETPVAPPPDMGAQVRLLPPGGETSGAGSGTGSVGDGGAGASAVAPIVLDNGRLRLQAAGLEHLRSRIDRLPAAVETAAPPAASPAAPEAPRPAAGATPPPSPPTVAAAAPPPAVAPAGSSTAEETGFLGSLLDTLANPLVVAGLGLAALLSGLVGVLAFRRAKTTANDTALAPVTGSWGSVEPPVALPPPRREAVMARAPTSAAPVEDPLERAALLLAVSNYGEARALLQRALTEAPDNTGLRARLIDVLYAMGDAASFRLEAGLLRQQVYGEADPTWVKVVRMGRELCPDDPLFAPPTPRPVLPDLAMELAGARAPAAVEAEPKAGGGGGAGDDDIWRELGLKPIELPELGVEAPTVAAKPVIPPMSPIELPAVLDWTPSSLAGGESAAAVRDGAGERAQSRPTAASGLSLEPLAAAPVAAPAITAAEEAPAGAAPAASTETDFVETKLDLAQAYLEMDDTLGARGLLDEVLEEGDEAQRERARALLEKLG